MSIGHFLELKERLEIQKYVKPINVSREDMVSFSGSPRKHPYDPSRVIIIADPFSENTFYYEFNIDDIVFVEDLSSISNLEGETVSMVRVWIRKKSIALRSIPFVVDTVTRV
ncbi:MAG: inorganic pyrophosphatase Ppa [Desulfobacteraceae bacterium]|nr:MAG: inorganic pyrophosphatase Ppa [Desulfobacteraceae bacterium]